MAERYINGVPCWIDTNRSDAPATAEFYRGLFGWELEDVMPPGSDTPYFVARQHGGDVGAISGGHAPSGDASWDTYIWVDDADATAAKVSEAGGTVVAEPFDVMGAGRTAVCTDPEGAQFCLWQAGTHRGASVINEHGAVNFNNLHSADWDKAKEFYGAVFGWGTLSMGADSEIWTLPAYGDRLEELNPGMRQGMKDMGAPEHFEEAVASLQPLDDGEAPHWSVTFGADDADAAAAKAADLGATVLAEPFDAPWVRMTVIRDPDGAVFTASQFVPPDNEN